MWFQACGALRLGSKISSTRPPIEPSNRSIRRWPVFKILARQPFLKSAIFAEALSASVRTARRANDASVAVDQCAAMR